MNVPGTQIPKPQVRLVGVDGNAFHLLGVVTRALKVAKVPPTVIDEFTKKAMAGTYDNLLRVIMEYVETT